MTLKTTQLRDAIKFALAVGATTVVGMGSALAQNTAPAQEATTLERVEVTGHYQNGIGSTDAASAGIYESANGRKFPRVQLLMVEGLLNHTQRAEHPDSDPAMRFKKAAKAETHGEQAEFL